ncbi:hypothetical protein MW887_002889 [Aspergillus wentii]|nr:hypothetical protein MW887_002889 [Aspergillus wentii]
MSAPSPQTERVGPSTLITVKVVYNDNTRRFKVPLRDLGAHVLPQKLRLLLGVPADVNVIFERYSDSAGCFVRLDSENVAVYKQLYRAAKAKLKIRIKATAENDTSSQPAPQDNFAEEPSPARYSYLETVLSSPLPVAQDETMPSTASSSSPSQNDTNQAALADSHPRYRDFMLSQDNLSLPVVSHKSPSGLFCIDCNHCGRSIPNEHYHCSICADGDYDLCLQCVDAGVSCQGKEHWLIKRLVDDGVVTNSTTEMFVSRKPQTQETEKPISEPVPEPVSEKASEFPAAPFPKVEERICNSCLKDFDETKIVTCGDCEDYDLCITCLLKDQHGHHPGHTFSLLCDRKFCLKGLVMARCSPGRRHQHAAICDGCESGIVGVRHKCLTCPDWDYCSECVTNSSQNHPGHRFVPIFDAISEPPQQHEVHYGILCDGPLCKNRPAPGYIYGTRYKCSVCYDTDFCAKCEALPNNTHNRTHPMVMFKTPVRSVTVSTVNETGPAGSSVVLGDPVQKSTSTQVYAPVEKEVPEEPRTVAVEPSMPVEKAAPVQEKEKPNQPKAMPVSEQSTDYQAFFIRDTVRDGSILPPNHVFQQTWTLYNPGPLAWPADSEVRFVGGDSMFNVDTEHPSSLASITAAMKSNGLSAPLEPGQSADFTVTLKTPNRLGVAISYWRLKLSDGMPFGHRLWCDVQVQTDAPAPTAVEPEKKETQETPKTQEAETSRSCMIFPTLDKESPVTSTHEAMEGAPSAPSVTNPSEGDIFEDVESLTLEDNDTEAGFLTDEEYDVLDASDQEFLEAKQVMN